MTQRKCTDMSGLGKQSSFMTLHETESTPTLLLEDNLGKSIQLDEQEWELALIMRKIV